MKNLHSPIPKPAVSGNLLAELPTTEDSAFWNGNYTLVTATFHYDWPEPHSRTLQLSMVPPCQDGVGVYWCAIGGKAFALRAISPDSCIANVESALRLSHAAGQTRIETYVIWQPKDHGLKAWERWSKKWTQRTAQVG